MTGLPLFISDWINQLFIWLAMFLMWCWRSCVFVGCDKTPGFETASIHSKKKALWRSNGLFSNTKQKWIVRKGLNLNSLQLVLPLVASSRWRTCRSERKTRVLAHYHRFRCSNPCFESDVQTEFQSGQFAFISPRSNGGRSVKWWWISSLTCMSKSKLKPLWIFFSCTKPNEEIFMRTDEVIVLFL